VSFLGCCKNTCQLQGYIASSLQTTAGLWLNLC